MAEPNEKKGLFAPKPAPPPPVLPMDKINDLSARLRINEQRTAELSKKLLFIEQNVISNHRTALSSIKTVQDELRETKHKLQDVEDTVMKIMKELSLVARKEDIDVMKRYLELWDPVKFATVDTVERMIDQKLGREPVVEEKIVEEEPEEMEEVPAEETEEIIEEGPEVLEPEFVKPDLDKLDFESLVKKHGKNE